MNAEKIFVVGSSNTDLIVRMPHLPKPGETILGGKFSTAAGGKGANQAVAAARAGGDVIFLARVGADAYGDAALAGLRRDGIDVSLIEKDSKKPSGVALIFVSEKGENSIAVADSANNALTPRHVSKAAAAIKKAGVLVVQLETPLETVSAAVKLAHAHGIPVILNPAPAQKLPTSLLSQVTYLTPNETECEILTGIKLDGNDATLQKAAEALLKKGVKNVIVTLGSKGAYVVNKDGRFHVPPFKVKPVDTTAAGDVFNGALALALLKKQELKEAVRFASAAAALSVTKLGAQPSAPRAQDIQALISKQSTKSGKS